MYSANATPTIFYRHLRQIIAAVVVSLSLLVAMGTALSPVATDRVPPGGDTFQRGCRSLQLQVDALVAEYSDSSTTDARRREIQGELRQAGSTWRQTGCQDVWGDIVGLEVIEPDAPYRDPSFEAHADQETTAPASDPTPTPAFVISDSNQIAR